MSIYGGSIIPESVITLESGGQMPLDENAITRQDAEILLTLLLQINLGKFMSVESALNLLNKLQRIKNASR